MECIFNPIKFIIFQGTSYTGGNANETVNIVTPARISNVTLGGVSGSSGDVYFNRLSGYPALPGLSLYPPLLFPELLQSLPLALPVQIKMKKIKKTTDSW